jgi:glutathione S-transferase
MSTLTLYHRPAAVCAQKVRIALAEKGVAWEGINVSKQMLRSPEYLKINPGGYVPTLVHGNHIIAESRIINEYIDEAFDGPPLTPAAPFDRATSRIWTRTIDEGLFLSIFTLTFVTELLPRYKGQNLSPSELDSVLPLDLSCRERACDIMSKGVASHYVADTVRRFTNFIADMERALEKTRWLACDTYSLADVDCTPYLQRFTDMGLASLWDKKPAVRDWWARIQARPSFSAVQADWLTPEELKHWNGGAERHAKTLAPVIQAV